MWLTENTNQVVEEAAKNVEESTSVLKNTLDDMLSWLIGKSGSVLVAILFIVIGMKLVGLLIKLFRRSFERSKMDDSVSGFLLSIIRIVGYILVFITAATIVGFEVTSFVTILGTASMGLVLPCRGRFPIWQVGC